MSDQSRVESDPGEDESEALGESSPWREGEAVVMPDWVCSVVWPVVGPGPAMPGSHVHPHREGFLCFSTI